jgi:hypothetical protein
VPAGGAGGRRAATGVPAVSAPPERPPPGAWLLLVRLLGRLDDWTRPAAGEVRE